MGKIQVRSEATYHNIQLFKQIASYQAQKIEKHSFQAYINRETGAMRFKALDVIDHKDWKPVEIRLNLASNVVEMFEEGGKLFDFSDLDSFATRVMAETFQVLQHMVSQVHSIEEIASTEVETSTQRKKIQDLIHEAWHPLDREGAEKILEGCPLETYFFRKDGFASTLEKELSQTLKEGVKCITLTYLNREEIVRDATLVYYKHKWFVYDDDPSLAGEAYEDINSILQLFFQEPKPLHY